MGLETGQVGKAGIKSGWQDWVQIYIKLSSSKAQLRGHEPKWGSWARGQRVPWCSHQQGWPEQVKVIAAQRASAVRESVALCKTCLLLLGFIEIIFAQEQKNSHATYS